MTRPEKGYLSVITCLILVLLSSCFSPYRGEEGNLVLTITGTGRAAGLDNAVIERLSHTITVWGGPGPARTRAGVKHSGRVSFTVEPGNWNISVKAVDSVNGVPRAQGAALGHNVAPGIGSSLTISMKSLVPGLYRETETGYDRENAPLNDLEAISGRVSNGGEDGRFILLIKETVEAANQLLLTKNTLSVYGLDAMATINFTNAVTATPVEIGVNGASTGAARLVLGSNITLLTNRSGFASFIKVEKNGTLIMEAGSAITGNTNTNVWGYGGGVSVDGKFVMNGGTISGNHANAEDSGKGGGVYVNTNGSFTMNGGTIARNTVTLAGGGVYVREGGTFRISGGTVYGSDDVEYGNTSTGEGAALYVDSGAAAEYGSFDGATWVKAGNDLTTTDGTILY